MKEKKIEEFHDELFNYLTSVHQQDPTFMFRVRRMNNQNRLDKGYWFNGNESYLETSFWDYKDTLHQTPVIRLVYIFESKEWLCELVGRDSRERETYFEQMGKALNIPRINESAQIWRVKLDGDFSDAIKGFINPNQLKSKIDEYVQNSPKEEVVRFLDSYIFKKDIDKINFFRENKLSSKFSTKLPYAISDINIVNFEGIKNVNEIHLQKETCQWIFFTGENSAGKTSILRALATGLTLDENRQLKILDNTNKNKPKIKITIKTPKGDKIWGINDGSDEVDEIIETTPFEKIAGYGASRLNMRKSGEPVEAKTATLFSDNAELHSIERELEKNQNFDAIVAKLLPIIQNRIGRIVRNYIDGDPEILFYEKDDDGNILERPVKLSNIGAGYKGIIMMLGDMLIRLSNKFKDLNNIEGIVIIDEIDANLHPKYQYELPNLLSKAFPKVQFIVSTHSPIPLLGLPQDVNAVIFKVNRTVKEGITVDRLDDDIDIDKISLSGLLSSEIFGKYNNILPRGATQDTILPFNPTEDTLQERLTNMQQLIKKLNLKPNI